MKMPELLSPLVDFLSGRLNGTEAARAQERRDTYPAPCHAEAPQPVKCCWNGGVSITAAAFYAGVRFRRGSLPGRSETECDFSECSVLCRDMRLLGFDRIEADPTIQACHLFFVWDEVGHRFAAVPPNECAFPPFYRCSTLLTRLGFLG